MNVFEFAIKMELAGQEFYEKLARGVPHAGLKSIFSQLAADEQKHYKIFSALKAQHREAAMADTPALEQAKTIFRDLLAQKDPAGPVKGDLEAYRYAIKLEADSFRLYEEAAAKEKDQGVKGLLLRIAGEEHKHFEILQNIYDFVNAPNQYLAWGEFSNLGEFRQFGRDTD
ncbi:MAG: ferritin family protein [Elusimicrobia bacterium]|nr:ferritin family protein [Elusimicrobiota bacterium]